MVYIKLHSSIQLFFVESRQAKTHQCDIIPHAVQKIGLGLLLEVFRSEGECFVSRKRGKIRKDGSLKIEVSIGVLKTNAANLSLYFLISPFSIG